MSSRDRHAHPHFPARFVHVPEARLRFGDRVDRIGAYLWKPDQLADDVVAAIEELPPGEGFRMVEEAASKGIESVPHAPAAFVRLFESCERVPPWVDFHAVNRGGTVLLRAGILGGIVLGSESLPLGYASPGGNKPLVMSGRLEKQALRRLNETARFVQAVCRKNGMKPGGDGYHITVKVRLMHAQVRRMILRSGRWDGEKWGLPVNQHDMAGTQLLFSMIVLDGLRKLGMVISAHDAECYMHLWRFVSYIIGVDQDIAPASEADGHRLAEVVRATEAEPDKDSRSLMNALLFAEVHDAKTKEQRRVGQMKAQIGMAFTRMLCGDDMAHKLGVDRTPLELGRPFLRRLVRTGDFVMRNVPGAERQALAVGLKYWDRVIEIGLAGAMAEFGLPGSLAA